MRKIYLFMMLSADGYFEGPEHDLSWHNTDEEFVKFSLDQLDATDTLVFGGRTYHMMADFWPTDHARQADPDTAERMNRMQKIVFSHTMNSVSWEETRLYNEDPGGVLRELKQRDGKDIAVLASSNLCVTLLKEGILDEVRLMINPVLLGEGTQLFDGLQERCDLALASSRTFSNGNVLLTYEVARLEALQGHI